MEKRTRNAPYLIQLVRDRVDEHLGDPGRVAYIPLDEATFIKLLQRKLADEAVEYLVDPTLEELGDVYEVMRGLAEHRHGGMEAVIAEADRKRAERGGYDRALGMFNVASDDDDAELRARERAFREALQRVADACNSEMVNDAGAGPGDIANAVLEAFPEADLDAERGASDHLNAEFGPGTSV